MTRLRCMLCASLLSARGTAGWSGCSLLMWRGWTCRTLCRLTEVGGWGGWVTQSVGRVTLLGLHFCWWSPQPPLLHSFPGPPPNVVPYPCWLRPQPALTPPSLPHTRIPPITPQHTHTGAVAVYYEEHVQKPPVGSGLNKPCRVVLTGVHKKNKPQSDPAVVAAFSSKLKRYCSDMGAKFVSYEPAEGLWTFEVGTGFWGLRFWGWVLWGPRSAGGGCVEL